MQTKQLDELFDTYRKGSSYDDAMRDHTFKTFSKYIGNNKANALEFGCSDGRMTKQIASLVGTLDVVDGSKKFLEQTRSIGIKNASFTHALFEDFNSEKKYDHIFATYVITHIPDLSAFYTKVKDLLRPEGTFFVAIPNSRVLSRQLALHMGLLSDLMILSENDKNHGHCRAYDRVHLNRELGEHGFEIIAQGGILLKPLADFQMDQLIDTGVLKKEQLDGLYSLGQEYPDLCGAIFAVCKKRVL